MRKGSDSRSLGRATVAFCVLAALCEGIDFQAAGVAAGGIALEFRTGPAQLGTFFSASTVGLFIGALISGRLADGIGRKRVLVGSMVLFGLFSLLTTLAFDMPSITALRLVTGLGFGGALPNLIALTSESSAGNRKDTNVMWMYSGVPFGAAIASMISMLLGAAQWRWLFIVGGIAPLLLAPIMAAAMQESPAFLRAQAAAKSGRLRGNAIEIFAGARAAATLLLWLTFIFGSLTLYLLANWLPTLLVGDGLTRTQAAGAQIGFNVGGALAALLVGYLLAGRLRKPAIVSTFVALPALVLLLANSPPQLTIVGVIVLLLGCAVVASQAFLYAMAPAQYPVAIRATGVGAAVAVGRIGAIAGPMLAGALTAMGHGSAQLLIDLLPIVVATSLSALWLARQLPERMENL